MPARSDTMEANATAVEVDGGLDISLGGIWQVTASRPSWTSVLKGRQPSRVRVGAEAVEKWDTSLLLFLFEVQEWCRAAGAQFQPDALPQKLRALLEQFTTAHKTSVP